MRRKLKLGNAAVVVVVVAVEAKMCLTTIGHD